MRRHLLAMALLFALPLFSPAATGQEMCEMSAPPEVLVETITSTVEYDFDRPAFEVAKIAREVNPVSAAAYTDVLGVSTARLIYEASTVVAAKPIASGVCSELKTLRLKIGFAQRRIYVARETLRDDCVHRAVLEHERRHASLDEELLAEFAKAAAPHLKAAFSRMRYPSATDTRAADQVLGTAVQPVIQRAGAAFAQARGFEQSRIDQPAKIIALQNACAGRVRSILD